jgi:hypothetical protein
MATTRTWVPTEYDAGDENKTHYIVISEQPNDLTLFLALLMIWALNSYFLIDKNLAEF